MRNSIKIGLLLAAVVLFLVSLVGAQEVKPDDRYRGYYPTVLVRWPTMLPDLAKCKGPEYYEPEDLHLVRYASLVKIAGERIQESAECVWMLTRSDWRWVLRPAGTKVAVDEKGRDLFDFGSPNGKVCANPRSVSIPIPQNETSDDSSGANLSVSPVPVLIPSTNEQKQDQSVGRTNVDVTIPEAPPPAPIVTTQTQSVGEKTVTVTVPPPPTSAPTTTTQTQRVDDTTINVTTPPQTSPSSPPNVTQEQKVGDTKVEVNVSPPPPPPPPPDVIQKQEIGDVNITVNVGGKRREEKRERQIKSEPRKSSQFFGPSVDQPSQTQVQRVGSRNIDINIEEPERRWGFTFGGILGRFDSDPISRIVGKLTNRDVCDITGWYADLGASFGRPRASFWRFIFTVKVIDELSNSQYFCSKCGAEVFVATRDMKVWGVGIERVQLFGPEKWPVRPTATVRLGVGIVTGQAERSIQFNAFQPIRFDRVGARELFSSNYMLDVGFAPGVTVLIGEHASVTIEGPGITSPGLHIARAIVNLRP